MLQNLHEERERVFMQQTNKKFTLKLVIVIALIICGTITQVFADGTGDSIGTWKELASIPFTSQRGNESFDIRLATLAGGNKILVTANSSDVFVYDISKNSWKQLKTRTMEYGQAAVALSDGRVLIIGGEKRTPLPNNNYKSEYIKTEIYNPANDGFTALAPLPESLMQVSAVVLKDGTVLAFGKNSEEKNIVYKYDVIKNEWAVKAKLGYVGARTLVNSKGNVFSYGASAFDAPYNPGEYYDYSKDIFSTSWVMPNPRASGACTVLLDGKFFIVGGALGGYSEGAQWDADIFDPEQNLWRTTSEMGEGRLNARAATLPDGRVVVMAGFRGKEYFKSTEIYNPVTDTWIKGPSLKYNYFSPAVVQLNNGNIIIIGGSSNQINNKCELLSLNPSVSSKTLQSYDKPEDAVLATVGTPYIKANGNKVILDDSNPTAAPISKDGQTMVPLSFFKKGFGVEIIENPQDSTFKIIYGGKNLALKLGSKDMLSSGKKTVMAASIQKINGIVYVPLRPVVEQLGKKITWLEGLIAVSDRAVYLDKISAYDGLTELDSKYKRGILDGAKLLKEVDVFSKDGWDYKWFYVMNDSAITRFSDNNCSEYTHKYLIRENKAEGKLEQVTEGNSGRVLKLEGDTMFFYDGGYLSKMKLGETYKEYVKSAAPLSGSENMVSIVSFDWNLDNFIELDNARVEGDWIYFTWSTIPDMYQRRDDPLGYPMRVKYDGSSLQILSRYQMEPNWRGIYGFAKSGDYLYYLTQRRMIAGTEEQFMLHRVKVDGSDEKDVAEVMYFDIYKDKIYYRKLGDTGKYDSVKFYSVNLDGSDNKLLSVNGAWEVQYFGDSLYYKIYNDETGVYTMKTDGSGVRKIGDVQGELLRADDRYVYYNYSYYDHDKNKFMNLGTYRIDIGSGKKEKAN
ncbi:MAG: stalk domain-containing protein [Caulobacteraceae bacterium]